MKHNIRKLIAFLLATACIISCTGCGANNLDSTQNSSDSTNGSISIEHSENTSPSAPTYPGDHDDHPTDTSVPSEPAETKEPEGNTDASDPSGEMTPSEPPMTEPSATEPSTTEPSATEPSATEPPATEPPITEPIPTTPVHIHTWEEATCTTPKTCRTCRATEGTAKGHTWSEATCTAPKTCRTCRVTEGTAKGHAWSEATCTTPKTCRTCRVTEGTAKGHAWSEATCTTPKTCRTCRVTEGTAKGHTWSEATCTAPKTCGTCRATEGTAKGHTIQATPGKAPTKVSDGLTKGEACTVCREVLAKQVVIPSYAVLYSGDFYYRQLMNYTNGTAMQSLYHRIDEAAMRFHFDTSQNAVDGIAFMVSYADLGLTTEDAVAVLTHYQEDHPLYYWIQSYTTSTIQEAGFGTDPAYSSGVDREKLNGKITAMVSKYLGMVSGEQSVYQIALIFHDAIIRDTKYANDPATGRPEDDAWAHNIVGFMDGKGVVCEGYARMFQLLLNAKGIQNILVLGDAGGTMNPQAHAWNLLQLEDGNWYWCDLTWDDRPSQYLGVNHNHFCVNDTQDINWLHGGWVTSEISFLQNHFPNSFSDGRFAWKITLPDRAATPFAGNLPKVRDIFTVDGMRYSVNGANTVQLVYIEKSGPITIPETVTYQGRQYTVNAVGSADKNGLYDTSSVIPVESGITTVYIPKTVLFIWDFAFTYGGTGFVVAEDNPNFRSLDGCLYTKSLYTLIQYPVALPRVDRFEIPEETRLIAYGALSSFTVRFHELVLGKNVEDYGIANWGSGYQDKEATQGDENQIIYGNRIVGTLGYVRDALDPTTHVTISVAEGNEIFSVENGIVYQYGDVVVASATSDVVHAVIKDGTSRIEGWSFNACYKLESVTIPESVTGFIGCPFVNCRSLEKIHYLGTVEQWNNIYKDDAMNFFLKDVQVICTDGTLEYPSIYS